MVAGSPGNWEVEDHADTAQAPAIILDRFSTQYGYAHLTAVDAHTLVYQWEETKQRDLLTGAFTRRDDAFWDEFEIRKTK